MMGICVSWQHLEVLEHVKWHRVLHLGHQKRELDRIGPTLGEATGTHYSRSEYKIDPYSLTLGEYTEYTDFMCVLYVLMMIQLLVHRSI